MLGPLLRRQPASAAGSGFHVLAPADFAPPREGRRARARPFRNDRKLTGVALRVHDDAIDGPVKDVLRLIDPEPVLDDELIALGKWISGYYCAPLGEVLRSMLPLASDIRSGKNYSLTDAGRDASRQLSIAASG